MRAKAGAFGGAVRVHQPAPQRFARDLFSLKALGANKAVAIARLTARDAHLVDHRVAIERMMPAERLVHWVFGVAQIDAVDIRRNFAFDHFQLVDIHFFMLRRPRAREVRVVAWLKAGFDRRLACDLHGCLPVRGRRYRLCAAWKTRD